MKARPHCRPVTVARPRTRNFGPGPGLAQKMQLPSFVRAILIVCYSRARFFVAKLRIGELTALHDSSIKLETVWTNWKNSEGSCILLLSICAIREIKFLVAKVSHVTTQAACPGSNLVRPRFARGPRGSSRRYPIFQIRSFKFKLPRLPWRA